jgi:hypothetical protein
MPINGLPRISCAYYAISGSSPDMAAGKLTPTPFKRALVARMG